MNCPNCGHEFKGNYCPVCRQFFLSSEKRKMSGVCPQCGKLVHFVFSSLGGNSWTSYAWVGEREASYAEELRELSGSRYTLYVPPETSREGLLEKIIHFYLSHGPRSSLVLSEEHSDLLPKIPGSCRRKVLRACLFPESPSYLAEKLIVENIGGELFSTEDTFHKKFQRI